MRLRWGYVGFKFGQIKGIILGEIFALISVAV